MSEQHYVIVETNRPPEKGEVSVYQTDFVGRETRTLLLRPANPPANPPINDRVPTCEDADSQEQVDCWKADLGEYVRTNYRHVHIGEWWRRIDHTPPPAEPTEAELFEELLTIVESEDCGLRAREKTRQIRAKQESEGCDEV